jgi:hypothetical protein
MAIESIESSGLCYHVPRNIDRVFKEHGGMETGLQGPTRLQSDQLGFYFLFVYLFIGHCLAPFV